MAIANFKRGDTRVWTLTVLDAVGAAKDISNHVLYMTFKKFIGDADGHADTVQVDGTITSGPGGIGSFTLTSTVSKTMEGKYVYDVQTASNDAPPVVTTIESGSVTVMEDVTVADA